jgi:hypothetical protein
LSNEEQSSNPDPEYSPGGIIPGPEGNDLVLAWISPGEEYFTAEDMRRLWEGRFPEGDEGPVSE